MTEIIPAILSNLWSDIEDKIKQVEDFAPWVQIDIGDGKFSPYPTWNNPADLELLTGKTKIEIHLMVENPEDVIFDWLQVADRLIVHPESTERLGDIVDGFKNHYVKLGLALESRTGIGEILPYVENLDVVQLMGIKNIGKQGEKFEPDILSKIALFKNQAPKVKVQVDGGVTLTNAQDIITTGSDRLVVGSAIWESDNPLATLKKFQNL